MLERVPRALLGGEMNRSGSSDFVSISARPRTFSGSGMIR